MNRRTKSLAPKIGNGRRQEQALAERLWTATHVVCGLGLMLWPLFALHLGKAEWPRDAGSILTVATTGLCVLASRVVHHIAKTRAAKAKAGP